MSSSDLASPDYYDVLGVERSIDHNRLTRAFRKLALKYHPDKNPDSEDKFKEIAKAYKILSDPETRKIYDESGEEGIENRQQDFKFTWDDFENLFRHFDADRRRTKDVKQKLDVTLEDIYSGTIKSVKVQKYVLCDGCKDFIEDCDSCKGHGKVDDSRCVTCKGLGYIDHSSYTCEKCAGTNVISVAKTYDVEIKPGLYNGQHIPFLGEGDEEPGALPGDRIFVAKTLDHPLYIRINFLDLATEVVITSAQKHTPGGHEVILPTLDGQEMAIRLPEGISNGRTLEIPDAGLPDYFVPSKKGSLFVNIKKVKNLRTALASVPIPEVPKPVVPQDKVPKRTNSFKRFDFMRNSFKGRRNDPNVRKSMPEFYHREDHDNQAKPAETHSSSDSNEANYENPPDIEKPTVESLKIEELKHPANDYPTLPIKSKFAKSEPKKKRGLFRTSFRKKTPDSSTPKEQPVEVENTIKVRSVPSRQNRIDPVYKEKRRSKGFLTNFFFN